MKMGEILKDFTVFTEKLETFVLAYSKKTNPINVEFDSAILRRCKHSNAGDFSVAAPMVERLKIKDVSTFSEMMFKESVHWPLPIKSCLMTDQGALSFKLHRPSVFKHILSSVSQDGDQYGRFEASNQRPDEAPTGVALVNNYHLGAHNETETEGGGLEDVTLSQLRGLLLKEHLCALLGAAGFQVHHLTPSTSVSFKILDCFGLQSFRNHRTEASSALSSKRKTQESLVNAASCSEFRTDPGSGHRRHMTLCQRLSGDDVTGRGSGDSVVNQRTVGSSRSTDVQLDLHHFIMDKKLPLGKSGYDKNLQRVKVVSDDGSPSHVLRQCCMIQHGLSQTHPLPCHLIHITNQETSFHQQQIDLTLRLCTQQAMQKAINQHHLTHGPVTVRRAGIKGKEHISAAELFRIREAQTREASVLKYGEEVQGEGWEQLIHRLTIAGLKFEILGKQCRHMLKLDLSNSRNSSTWPDSRDGVFVMYNYARLCTLFSHFDEDVAKGTYPPLPSISSIDFSLLREDQEWGLVFNYILQYPIMLSECVSDLQQAKGPHINIQTHRICSFLASLCRDLSSYYSHTHILGEPRSHLVAVMFARLHLLRGVHQVLKSGFSLLNIEPLTQM